MRPGDRFLDLTGSTNPEISRLALLLADAMNNIADLHSHAHSDLTGVGTDDHHAREHTHDPGDGSVID